MKNTYVILAFTLMSVFGMAGCDKKSSAKVLSKSSIRVGVEANKSVPTALHYVYDEMVLRHFMDSSGKIVFADGTSVNRDREETASRSGSFTHQKLEFKTPTGGSVRIDYYVEDGEEGLVVWECNGADPNMVSEHLQVSLYKSGVTVE